MGPNIAMPQESHKLGTSLPQPGSFEVPSQTGQSRALGWKQKIRDRGQINCQNAECTLWGPPVFPVQECSRPYKVRVPTANLPVASPS